MAVLSFEIAGAFYRENDIKNILGICPDWKKSPEDLIKKGKTGKYIYKYKYYEETGRLEYEPTNKSNPNAVAIYSGDTQFGYVPERNLAAVRKLMELNAVESVSVTVNGGPRMKVEDDGDVFKYDDSVTCTCRVHYIEEALSVNISHIWTAFFLCLFLGWLGAHKFYEKKTGLGILYLLTFGLCFIGWIVDLIVYISKIVSYKKKVPGKRKS